MPVINTNVSALQAQNALAANSRTMASAMQQLSSGSRINSARDDAAGLGIAQTMTSQIRGLNQAVRNANDGVNMLQTAEGAMVEQSNMLQRMRELAVQSANGTNSADQRQYLQNEFTELRSQIGSIQTQTLWNDKKVLSGGAIAFQTGMDSGQTVSVTFSSTSISNLAIDTLALNSVTSASSALLALDSALTKVNAARSNIGAGINRLTYTADNLSNVTANLAASRSSIADTDYASASTALSRGQIIQQAATAMLAQANQQPQSVLALLK